MLYDLIIIGGGPAGMTAGIYAARQKLNTLLISKDFGGQMAKKAVDIANYPGFEKISGLDLIKKFEKHLRKQTIDMERDEVASLKKINNSFFVSTSNKHKFEAKAVIIATGADPRPIEVPGEKELIGKGVSYCSICDGPLFSGKNVAIIGGGNSAFETAQFLNSIVKKIYILEYASGVKADSENQEIVKKGGKTEIITNAALKEIKGDKFVDSIVYQDRKTKKDKTLSVQGVFVEIGYQPATSFIKDLVDFNDKDEIKIDPDTFQTKIPGLFAAGDVTAGKFKQIVIAAGQGAKASLAVLEYLKKLP